MSLAAFVLRRLLWAIPLLLFVMLLTFLLMRAAGGSPFQPPEGVPGLPAPLQREMTEFYDLDEPWPVEFATYVKHVVTLDFGPSLVNRYRSVDDAVEQGFPTPASSSCSPPPGRFRSDCLLGTLRGRPPRLGPRPSGHVGGQRSPRGAGLLRHLRALALPRATSGTSFRSSGRPGRERCSRSSRSASRRRGTSRA